MWCQKFWQAKVPHMFGGRGVSKTQFSVFPHCSPYYVVLHTSLATQPWHQPQPQLCAMRKEGGPGNVALERLYPHKACLSTAYPHLPSVESLRWAPQRDAQGGRQEVIMSVTPDKEAEAERSQIHS